MSPLSIYAYTILTPNRNMISNYVMTPNYLMIPSNTPSRWSIHIVHDQLVTNKINSSIRKRVREYTW